MLASNYKGKKKTTKKTKENSLKNVDFVGVLVLLQKSCDHMQ